MQHLWGLSLRLTSKVGQPCFSAPGPWASGAQSRARSSGLVHVATPCCGFLGWTLFLPAASRSPKGKLSQGKRRQMPGSQGPQSSHRWAGPQTSTGAHQESQTSAEAGGTGDSVSWKSDVSSRQCEQG